MWGQAATAFLAPRQPPGPSLPGRSRTTRTTGLARGRRYEVLGGGSAPGACCAAPHGQGSPANPPLVSGPGPVPRRRHHTQVYVHSPSPAATPGARSLHPCAVHPSLAYGRMPPLLVPAGGRFLLPCPLSPIIVKSLVFQPHGSFSRRRRKLRLRNIRPCRQASPTGPTWLRPTGERAV